MGLGTHRGTAASVQPPGLGGDPVRLTGTFVLLVRLFFKSVIASCLYVPNRGCSQVPFPARPAVPRSVPLSFSSCPPPTSTTTRWALLLIWESRRLPADVEQSHSLTGVFSEPFLPGSQHGVASPSMSPLRTTLSTKEPTHKGISLNCTKSTPHTPRFVFAAYHPMQILISAPCHQVPMH